MTTKILTTEKILAEALELHEKGVSLHSIVRTYPEHREEIEGLFASMATLSLEKEKVRVPEGGLERLLAALPEAEPVVPVRAPMKSPFVGIFASLRVSSLKFVLPIAALALITGGALFHKGAAPTPLAVAPMNVSEDASLMSTEISNDAQPMAKTMNPAAKTAAAPTAPAAGAPVATMMSAQSYATTTDRMVASFSEEAAQEAEIAKGNDEHTATAMRTDKELATNPAYEN